MEIKDLIKKIKEKRELKDIDNSFVGNRIKEYLNENNLNEKFKDKNFIKTSSYKKMFKYLRKNLRETYGVFRAKTFVDNHSIKERLVFYKEIYYKIFSITGKPKGILDLGCGLNPLSYKYLSCNPIYYACDISNSDLIKIRQSFKKDEIKGKVFKFNLVDDPYSKLPKVDICFLFKILESLEQVKRNISREIIQTIKCDWIIVSFSKKSLSGKKIEKKGRSWFRTMLKDLNLYYTVFDIGNEIFFVIKKE